MSTASENWKKIQAKVGASVDGQPGPQTALKIMAALGIPNTSSAPVAETARPGNAEPSLPMPLGLVKGTGKNIRRIVIHCTATREGQDISVDTIRKWHQDKGWGDIGYHFVVGVDGVTRRGRDESLTGVHVKGFNTGSIGVVYVGGLDAQGKGKDTRTSGQKKAMAQLIRDLLAAYPQVKTSIVGHRDLSPDKDGDGVVEKHEWLKECPCFDVASWLKEEGI